MLQEIVASYTIKQADAAKTILHLNDNMNEYIQQIHDHASPILDELAQMDALKSADETYYAQTCLVFAILSPQCWFDRNVRACQRFMAHIDDDFERVEDVFDVITNDGIDSWITSGMAARSLFKSLDTIRALTPDDMHKEILFAYKKAGILAGIGEKTASMACALFDATEEVFTLDVHMLRFVQQLTGSTIAGRMNINRIPYRMLEAAFVEWHKEHLPEYPIFVSQWALWEIHQGAGHINHLDIFKKVG